MKSLFSRKKNERKRRTEGSTLRQVNTLIREIRIVEDYCGVKRDDAEGKDGKLDKFQRNKLDFADLMKTVKDDIAVRNNMEEKLGNNSETIKMKQRILKSFEEAKKKHGEMVKAYEEDERKFNKNKKDALEQDALEERKEMLDLLKKDLEYTEHQFKPKGEKTGGQFNLARQAREKRRKMRETGELQDDEPRPLSQKEQEFMQMSIQKDKELEKTLDEVLKVVKQVREVAEDINEELEKQDQMMDEIDNKMDKLQEKLESRNKQMKKLLEASGGAQRWCPIIILLIILMALLGYIYNLATGSG